MTTSIPAGILISVLILSFSLVSEGNIGDACSAQNACPPSEICGSNGTCECEDGFGVIAGECVKECSSLDDIASGSVQIVPNEETKEFEAIYVCISGYELVGEPRRQCLGTGSWNGTAPSCRKKGCPYLTSPDNGRVTLFDSLGEFGFVAMYSCSDGFEINGGDATRDCQADGQWSGIAPNCTEIVDPCDPNPCPTPVGGSQYPCVTNEFDQSAHVCICPVGQKGNTCTEDDPPVSCRERRNKFIYFETNPTTDDKTACMPKKNSAEDTICYNPNEDIVYQSDSVANVDVDDTKDDRYCLTYTNTAPEVTEVCVEIIAYEADDIIYRPWVNDSFQHCFVFNREPKIFPLNRTLLYNVLNMPDTVTVPLRASDIDNQTLTFFISDVSIAEFGDKFSIAEENLIIANPVELYSSNLDFFEDVFTVQITATDDGVPQLQDSTDIDVQFVHEELLCTVPNNPFSVHLNPVPTDKIELSEIQCTADGSSVTPAFEIISNKDGPLIVEADGTVFYDPAAAEARGHFTITVQANLTLTVVVVTRFNISVFAAEFDPRCSPTDTPRPLTISEKDVTGTCTEIAFTCDGPLKLLKTCTDTSQKFDVSCDSVSSNVTEVKVCSAASLDLQAGLTETVSIEVSNEYGVYDLSINVTITNVNDPPKFVSNQTEINITLSEETTPSTVLTEAVLPVADPDTNTVPPFDTLTASITDLENKEAAETLPFTASVNTFGNAVSVTLSKPLNPKVRDSYRLEVKVEDSSGESDTVNLNINIVDVNEGPTCNPVEVNTSATVRDAVDYVVTRLTCIDDDFSEQFSSLTYSLEGESTTTDYFSIDSNGAIHLKKELTTFTSGTQLSFTARVTDGGGLSDSVKINVDVITSYPPECDLYKVTQAKSEKTEADDCFLLAVNCKDPVNAETLTFSNPGGNGTGLFFRQSEGTTNVQISLCTSKSLQGSIGEWHLNLMVTSSYGSRNIQIIVQVEDVNDPPSCAESEKKVESSADDKTGEEVTSLICSDPDVDANFKTLVYTLEGQADVLSYFEINSGVISLAKPLADIIGTDNILTFTVKVEDGGGLFDTVTVTVTVNNDFPPTCDKTEFEVTISEATDADVCLTTAVGCSDSVQDETLEFTFTSGNGTTFFYEKDSTNTDIKMCTSKSLQGSYGAWEINAVVKSSYGNITLVGIVRVTDKNDRPEFSAPEYSQSVYENATVNTVLFSVTATDQDSGALGRLTYHSTDMDSSDLFTLNINTGEISVTSTLDADTSGTVEYNFVVTAVDGAPLPLSATARVSIEVLDVNDEVPSCNPSSTKVTIALLAPVDFFIAKLDCSDADKTPEYRVLKYSTTSSYFSVNSTGHVTLTSQLPRDVAQHEVDVMVSDSDKLTFSTNAVITVNVNNNVPPICTPENIVRTLKETDGVNVCIDEEVMCTDPTGGDIFLQSLTGTARKKGLIGIHNRQESGKLVLSACIISSLKDMFGTYELIGNITNGLATTAVSWSFTVENVNEPPVFTPETYDVEVAEDLQINAKILELTVSDPDDGMGNADFELDKVNVKLSNNGDFGGALSDAIIFLEPVRSFYAYRQFNATVRNVYEYIVTALDKSGLNSTASVTINIKDVNSAPKCEPDTLETTINILAKENDLVVKLSCYDTDIEPENTQLDYVIVAGDSNGYFIVTGNGELRVQKALPRDELIYNTGKADVRVKVSDRGTPPLSTYVTASVTVDRAIPASCKPAIVPPDIWIQYKCVTIQMDCTDPTKIGTDHLKYTISGNLTAAFTEKSNALGTIEMCYNLVISGVFQVSVSVDNGLGSYIFTDKIVVSYSQATPVFSKSKYTDTISENAEAGTIVIVVDASSADLIGTLQYNVLGTESTEGWSTYFSLDSTNGQVTTLTGIKTFANQVVTLKVEAVDTASQLRSSVLVELTVQDINEQPTCTITSSNLNINVDEAVDTQIIAFSCNDPDVKEEFRTLTYDISGADVDIYFKLDGEPANSVKIKAPLHISTYEYKFTLTVSDKGTPPLTFSQDFTINVDTLPPPVDVVAVAQSFDTIEINWDYARPEFYDVTNNFRVKVLSADNVIVKQSSLLPSSTRTYDMTGLLPVTQYNIVVDAITDAGTQSSQPVKVTTKAVPVLTHFTATMVVNKDYNERLRDELSQIYYEYRTEIVASLTSVLKDTPGFAGIRDVRFRPYNSVLVDFQGSVNQSGNVDATILKLNQTISSGSINSLSVQSNYFKASTGGGYIIIDGLSFTPAEVFNGTETVLRCNITAVGYSEDEAFEYWWTYNGNRLNPTSQSRYSLSMTADTTFYEYKRSFLSINPIVDEKSGLYGCFVRDSKGRQQQNKLTVVRVVAQPTVFILPKSQTLTYGANVNVTCGLAISPGTFERFVWYRNGLPFLKESNEIITSTDFSMTISVIGIKKNVVYGCEGKNNAGSSARVFSYLGVIPQDANTEQLCPEADDNRGTVWNVSAPDTVARLNCKTGFTGEIYRVCSAAGKWEPPVYDCVREQLQNIEQQMKDIQDGSKPLNLTETLVSLNTETTDNTLFEGDLDTAVNSLDIAVGITDDTITYEEKETRKTNFLQTCSNLIADPNAPAWISSIEVRQQGAISIPKLVEQYNVKTLDNVPDNKEETVTVDNIYLTVGAGKKDEYSFPNRSATAPDWVKSTKTGIVVQGEAFKDIEMPHFASSFFRNITPILVKKLKNAGVVTDITSMYDINSDIVAFQLKESIAKVDPPAVITFQHFDSNYSDPICCYWDFDEGAFLTDGCTLVSTDDEFTVCKCSHFTNFAVLMSPGKTPAADVMALSIISAVGCGISILCLLLTIILHAIVWRFVKSDRAILLLNLCVALIISYIVFLAGVDRVENKDVCTAVAALLHFFYLVVFFLMLAYGIEIGVAVVYVFITKSRIKWLLPLAWGIPLVIVGISMGATQLDGYGNESFCWLSIEDGLLWAFVGPAALVILINFVIVIVVLRQLFKSSVMMTKSDKEKATTGVRSICVLLPILGLTWVFGVFSVNENLVAFQYIFAICNSLQGCFIFLFHCIFNKQLKQALKQRSERKKSLQTIENSLKNPHSTTGSTAFISNENKLSQGKDVNSGSSNPFLEADRQMKELVSKNKKSSNLNDNLEANNKVELDKSSKAIDLEDVKISNIIRESEVMGGTAGISSILQSDNRTEDEKRNDAVADRPSIASSHRYDYVDSHQPGSQPSFGMEKPPGYEKLLQGTGLAVYTSKDSVHSGSDKSRDKEKEKRREKERERERELERERQKKIEKEKHDRIEKERHERERMERENDERERKERERREREIREREQRERDRHQESGVIRIGYSQEGYNAPVERRRNGSHGRRSQPESARSSRTDDDYESGSSAQNVTSINTALPEKFEFYQGKKRQQKEAKKQSESSLKRKDKKKTSLKDRSKAYEYSYDTTYLGGASRHASLENMNMQNQGYSPYAQMPGYSGYQTGRPTIQQQHWDQYGYQRGQREPRDPREYDPYSRDPYRRDYW